MGDAAVANVANVADGEADAEVEHACELLRLRLLPRPRLPLPSVSVLATDEAEARAESACELLRPWPRLPIALPCCVALPSVVWLPPSSSWNDRGPVRRFGDISLVAARVDPPPPLPPPTAAPPRPPSSAASLLSPELPP